MPAVCLIFEVHQPYSLEPYSFFQIGKGEPYVNEKKTADETRKRANDSILPGNARLLSRINAHNGAFKVAFSISGIQIELWEMFCPEVIDSFRELAQTGSVEFIAQPYHHSLSFLNDREEFQFQIELHRSKLYELFGLKTQVLANTWLLYNNPMGYWAHKLGFKGIITEGASQVLQGRNPNHLYSVSHVPEMPILLRNPHLSGELAARMSDTSHPLTPEGFAGGLNFQHGDVVSLMLNHHLCTSNDSNLQFWDRLPEAIFRYLDLSFAHPSEILDSYSAVDTFDSMGLITQLFYQTDFMVMGNPLQKEFIGKIWELETLAKEKKSIQMMRLLKDLQDVDYLIEMREEGDLPLGFQPLFGSAQEMYIHLMGILSDIKIQLSES